MISQALDALRRASPLVLNITNYVVMNNTANALLALGASPVMAHAPEEIEEMTALASALVINIGTLSAPWVESMCRAGKAAAKRGIPIVLDPVGSGATTFRTMAAQRLIDEAGPTIIRGNASEILALAGSERRPKGVDSVASPDEIAAEAVALANRTGCVVSISGPEDLIVEGRGTARIANGHPMMTRVTGLGCTASAVTGAFAAVCPSPFDAAVAAMAVMGIAGELAADRAQGPGSLQMHLLDTLYGLRPDDFEVRLRLKRA